MYFFNQNGFFDTGGVHYQIEPNELSAAASNSVRDHKVQPIKIQEMGKYNL